MEKSTRKQLIIAAIVLAAVLVIVAVSILIAHFAPLGVVIAGSLSFVVGLVVGFLAHYMASKYLGA